MHKFFNLENILLSIFLLVVINLIILDVNIFQNNKQGPVVSPVSNNDCPNCQEKISNLQLQLNTLMQKSGIDITPMSTPTPKTIIQYQPVPQQGNNVKEYYVPFGSGSGNYSNWTDIPGLQAYIDSNSYGNLQSVIFEAALHIPTGNETASVRLVNATDGRVVSGSELVFNGNSASVLLSSPISLDYGQKLYKVQLKTQLQYNAVLDQSRVHITSQ